MRKERQIYNIQPLQLSTVKMAKNSFIRGEVETPFDVVGSALAALITVERSAGLAKVQNGTYLVEVTAVGDEGTGKYKIHDIENNTVSAELTTSADAVSGIIAGLDITIPNTTGTTVGDTAQFVVIGDQTRIIPGTVVGRVNKADDPNFGLFVPAYDDIIANLDTFRIVNGFCETDKSKLQPEYSKEVNISDNYTTSVVVFGEITEANCVNLTSTLKEKLTGIVWA